MVVSATIRYGTSVSHISLPQTSVSVDSWVVKEKSKNYHNWTSSASHDVCAAPIFTYIMSGCGLIYEKWMCVKSEGRGMRAELCVKRTIPPCFAPWFNWIFSITLCRNTDKYKLQAVLHTMWNALEVQSCWLLDFFLAPQLASYMDVRMVASPITTYMKSLRDSRLKLLALNIVCRTACSLYLSSVRHQLIFN